MNRLRKKDKKTIDALTTIGLSGIKATILIYISQNQPVLAKEIERGADLRQPVVCREVNQMIKKGWVKRSKVKMEEGRGRPQYEYRLRKTIKEIVSGMAKEKKEEIKKQKKAIEKIETLTV